MKFNFNLTGFANDQSTIAKKIIFHLGHHHAMILIAMAFIAIGFVVSGCGGNKNVPVPTYTTTPSRKDIIQAVKRGVEGKTYTVSTSHEEPIIHRCSQQDVDFDPYMPHNPELAKCPSVGATYTEWKTVHENKTLQCAYLPNVDAGWYVESKGDDRWQVSISGSTWDVKKLNGASANTGDYVRVSSFTFMITPHQDC